jgi:cytochrome b561
MRSSWKSSKAGYGLLSISFHWLMLLLIVATYAMMDLKSMYPKNSHQREVMAIWHYMLGLSVFFLVWFRLWARSIGSLPVIRPALSTQQAILSKFVQWSLYALMIGLPLLGWLTLSARGTPVPFWGIELPALLDKSRDVAILFKNIHEPLATLGYFLVGLHAAAALFHHYVKRDNTLRLMLPGGEV